MDKEPEITPIKEIPSKEIWPVHFSCTGAVDIKPQPGDVGISNKGDQYYFLLDSDCWWPITINLYEYNEQIKFAKKATIISKRKHYAKKNSKKK